MSAEKLSIRPGETKYAENGVRLTADFIKKKAGKTPGKTARHEGKHTTVAYFNGTSVESVTIIPGPGYLGLTKLGRFDAAAAAAAYADGDGGTGHDEAIVVMMGRDLEASAAAARGIMRQNEDIVEAVAEELEEKGTLFEPDIKEIVTETQRRRVVDEVVVYIKNPDGSEEQHIEQTEKKGAVVVEIAKVKEKRLANQERESTKAA